ncbi:hypothetical protein J437_LFUL018319 [Ladona fulva]|uniref:Uncharacterized protein n=1 Tax=Ladona fulva TaxID=123851 RepID=A0A8K0KS37_LADFU|nr:hypothetical protein J437_LFUL018319 [Ladona fulva]
MERNVDYVMRTLPAGLDVDEIKAELEALHFNVISVTPMFTTRPTKQQQLGGLTHVDKRQVPIGGGRIVIFIFDSFRLGKEGCVLLAPQYPVKGVFSKAGTIHCERRSLKPKRLSKLLFLNFNLQL